MNVTDRLRYILGVIYFAPLSVIATDCGRPN